MTVAKMPYRERKARLQWMRAAGYAVRNARWARAKMLQSEWREAYVRAVEDLLTALGDEVPTGDPW